MQFATFLTVRSAKVFRFGHTSIYVCVACRRVSGRYMNIDVYLRGHGGRSSLVSTRALPISLNLSICVLTGVKSKNWAGA